MRKVVFCVLFVLPCMALTARTMNHLLPNLMIYIPALKAVLWKNACLLYFQQFSSMPIPYDIERPINNLDDIITNDTKKRRL